VAEAIGFYYGPIIDRFFGVEADPSSMFMEDRDSNTSKETLNRAIERVLEAQVGAPGHVTLVKRYWERYGIPTGDGAGREITQAYALIRIARRDADEIVAQLLGESPTQIAIAGLEREAAFLVAEAKKQSIEGLRAGDERRVPDMLRAHERAKELLHDLERVKKRHAVVSGAPLTVEIGEARDGIAALDRRLQELLGSLRLGVAAELYSGAEPRARGVERLVAGILNGLSIATASPDARHCAAGNTHWLKATFAPPSCVRPTDEHVCDLSLTLELGRCPSLQPVDSYRVEGAALRGRGGSDRRAVLKAWESIETTNLAALTRELHVLISRHLPTGKATF